MSDEKLIAFGKTVRALRHDKDFSQEKLAALIGIDQSYLGRIERGEKNISLLMLYQISKALNVSPTIFFQEEHTK